jgi:type I restriction enzyme S subunit
MKLLGSGVRQTISFNNIANSELPYPNLGEQDVIANFLNDKCEKIDAAVDLKEQQIEKLKELHQITIHNAVTKGISHFKGEIVPTKYSGIDWIGEIPKHWEVKKLKSFIKNLEGGVSVNASETENASSEEVGVLKTSAVYKYSFEPAENKKVFESEIKRVSCPVRKGAIIISRMNAPELVGASGIVLEDYPNLYLPDRLWQTVYNENIEFDNFWLSKILISSGFRSFMSIFANGSSPSMKNISKGDFLNIFIPVPPITEQREIVTYLKGKIAKIDKAISQRREQIIKLKEYKQSLISEVVTGKIKVTV